MKSVIIGATAGIGRELAISLAKSGHSLLIVGKDKEDVAVLKKDLFLRFRVDVIAIASDATSLINFKAILEQEALHFGKITNLFLPIGSSKTNDTGELGLVEVFEIINSNFLAAVIAVDVFRRYFDETGHPTIIGLSSVAAMRGRSKNIIYSASKRALESYFQSLTIQLIDSNVSVQLYRLGYIDTNLSYGKRLYLPRIIPQKVSKHIINNLGKSSFTRYFPRYWRVINYILILLPSRLFSKIKS